MRRSMLCSLVGIVVVLLVSVTCSKQNRFALTTTALTTTVDVALRFTGISHLVGTAPDERLMVVPNLTAASTKHIPVIIASETFPSNLANRDKLRGRWHKWSELKPGFAIALAPLNANLILSENGDPREMCPNNGVAPIAKESLHWLPRLSYISRVASPAVDPKYTLADPSSNDVAVRLPITRGKLQADSVTRNIFAFKDGLSTMATQSVASFLRYDFQVELTRASAQDPFELVLMGRRFTDAGGGDYELGRFQPSARGDIEIIIANLPDKAFFNPAAHGPLAHFKDLSYRITTGISPTTPDKQAQKCGGGTVGSEVECGPVRVP